MAFLSGSAWAISVTLNLNGGTWSTAPSGVASNANYTFTVATGQLYSAGTGTWNWASPTKSGKAFRGWNTNANGTGNYFGPNALVQSTTNQTLYAVWVEPEVLPSTSTICPGGTTTLCASSNYASWSWSPAAGLSSTTARCPTLTANNMPSNNVTYTCNYGPSINSGIVYNNDFSLGNTGFTSQYTYHANVAGSNTELNPQETYTVASCWATVHNSLDPNCILKDHTTGTASGKMMLVNGGDHPESTGDRVWEQTVAVYPNTTYQISMWVAAAHYPEWEGYPNSVLAPAQLQFYLNDSPVGELKTINSYNWQKISVNWNSGNNYTATISIRDFCTIARGNDFAIDDIEVKALNQALTYTIVRRNAFSAGSIATAGQSICVGGTVNTITSTAAASGGNNAISYQWYHNGEAISGATSATYTPTAYRNQVGTHTFTRKAKDTECNPSLTNSSGSWVLKVNPLPAATISNVATLCPNGTTTITGTVSTTTTPNYTFTWNGGGMTISQSSVTQAGTTHTPTLTAPNNCNGSYTVTLTVKDGNGCTSSQASKSVTVKDATIPTVNHSEITASSIQCAADTTPAVSTLAALGALGFSFSDNCSAVQFGSVVSNTYSGSNCNGTRTTVYQVKDGCNNTLNVTY